MNIHGWYLLGMALCLCVGFALGHATGVAKTERFYNMPAILLAKLNRMLDRGR